MRKYTPQKYITPIMINAIDKNTHKAFKLTWGVKPDLVATILFIKCRDSAHIENITVKHA